MTRLFSVLLLVIAATLSAEAEPARYRLDADASSVSFSYTLSGQEASGTMPISRADLVLDFDQAARSTAQVTLNANGAKTGVIFVTQALKSAQVLDTGRHPQISFTSRQFRAVPGGARLTGDVTIRGVTQPLTLDARIFRRAGTAEGDRSRLTVLLTGSLDRRSFGADGYSDLVAPTVDLEITARLTRIDG